MAKLTVAYDSVASGTRRWLFIHEHRCQKCGAMVFLLKGFLPEYCPMCKVPDLEPPIWEGSGGGS